MDSQELTILQVTTEAFAQTAWVHLHTKTHTDACTHTQTPSSVQFSSVDQLCLTLCDPMDCSTPGLPVHHQLPELVQTHVHQVSDAIQPLSSPFPSAFNLSQHQGLFQ